MATAALACSYFVQRLKEGPANYEVDVNQLVSDGVVFEDSQFPAGPDLMFSQFLNATDYNVENAQTTSLRYRSLSYFYVNDGVELFDTTTNEPSPFEVKMGATGCTNRFHDGSTPKFQDSSFLAAVIAVASKESHNGIIKNQIF